MKYFKSKAEKESSWSINVLEGVGLVAVDSDTGEEIGIILKFLDNGKVKLCSEFKEALELNGYNPYEHKNAFNEDGQLVIGEY